MWKTKGRENLFQDKWITVTRNIVELPSGEHKEYVTSDVLHGVLVIPIKIIDGKVRFVLVEQYRYPTGIRHLEFPGGACENGERKEETAKRELFEETGYKTKNIKFIYRMFQNISVSSSEISVYVARLEDEREGGALTEEEKEVDLRVVEVSDDELLKMINENEITDMKSIAALSVFMMQSKLVKNYLSVIES